MKLRVIPQIGPDTVNLGFVRGQALDPEIGLTLLDLSREEAGNYVVLRDRLVDATTGDLPTKDVLVSTRSVLNRDQHDPASLYFAYTPGRGHFFLTTEGVASDDPLGAQAFFRRNLRFVRTDGSPAEVVWDAGAPAWAGSGWNVTVFLDRQNTPDQTIWIKYDGWDRRFNIPAWGITEVVNSDPIGHNVQIYEYGTDETAVPAGYRLTTLDQDDYAPAIGLFQDEASPPLVQITASQVQILTSPTVSIDAGSSVSVDKLVANINRQDAGVYATVLNSSYQSGLVPGTYVPTVSGTVVRHNQLVQVRVDPDARIGIEKPYPTSPALPWHPRIRPGSVVQVYQPDWSDVTTGNSPVRRGEGNTLYGVPEFTSQEWSKKLGRPWREVVQETPKVLDSTTIQLARRPLSATGIIPYLYETALTGTAATGLLRDYDLQNGLLFLDRPIERRDGVAVDYTYREKWYEYRGIDLNPNPKRNPDMSSLYVGIFLVPVRIKIHTNVHGLPVVNQTFGRTVYHVYGESYVDVIDRINTYTRFRTNESSVDGVDDLVGAAPFILGVFRAAENRSPEESLDIVDARRAGGGLRQQIRHEAFREAPEGQMMWDVARWDGEPFPAANVLIAHIPELTKNSATGYPPVYEGPLTGEVWATPTGRFTQEELDDILHIFPAAGTLVLSETKLIYPQTG